MSDYRDSMYLNRTLCDVLNDMRKCNETRNYALIKSLIEEAQIMANRMEAGLSDLSDARYSYERVKELKAEIKKLKEEKKNVTGTGD